MKLRTLGLVFSIAIGCTNFNPIVAVLVFAAVVVFSKRSLRLVSVTR